MDQSFGWVAKVLNKCNVEPHIKMTPIGDEMLKVCNVKTNGTIQFLQFPQ